MDNYLMLIDYNNFITSIDQVSSKSTKVFTSATDRQKLKDYLKSYFITKDILTSTDKQIPENIDNVFNMVFRDYLKSKLRKGEIVVYDLTKKAYEKIIVEEVEEKIGDNNVTLLPHLRLPLQLRFLPDLLAA